MVVYTHYSPFRNYFAKCAECGAENRFVGAIIDSSEAGAAAIAKEIMGDPDMYVVKCQKCGGVIPERLWVLDRDSGPLAATRITRG